MKPAAQPSGIGYVVSIQSSKNRGYVPYMKNPKRRVEIYTQVRLKGKKSIQIKENQIIKIADSKYIVAKIRVKQPGYQSAIRPYKNMKYYR